MAKLDKAIELDCGRLSRHKKILFLTWWLLLATSKNWLLNRAIAYLPTPILLQ
ncbi:hypothetical protein [Tenacibaculum maritimum]|uniref:hypothetical protein n=1 Tax=Tenacibaculum maritimum TaxID=107401 RepID=UPI00132F51A8|nr:hypothetical protein [Tenacibaculum maritimum]